ncbi:MAG: nucleotidyltransferase domain-containing protein [Euryarchaeota archaeon]|nr:nucleotidyltransferase domain-containing protein [Euryarchaeota archaeon]
MFEKMNITPLSMQILTFLARHPDQEFYMREIAQSIKKSVGGTHNALKSLYAMNFLIEKKSGKNIYYRINSANPSVKNFKIFVTTTELNPLINDLKNIAEKIILFGSCSVGDDTAASDIDLFVLSHETEKVKSYLKKKQSGRTIQAVVVNAAELMKLKERDKAFYQEINKGITLWEAQK